MHLTTVSLTGVTKLLRLDDGRRIPGKQTVFTFSPSPSESAAVFIDGNPRVEEGLTVTAVLAREGDWQKVKGWLDHETGVVYVFGRSALTLPAFALLIAALAAALVWGLKQEFLFSGLQGVAPVILGVVSILWFCTMVKVERQRSQVGALLRSFRHDLQANGADWQD